MDIILLRDRCYLDHWSPGSEGLNVKHWSLRWAWAALFCLFTPRQRDNSNSSIMHWFPLLVSIHCTLRSTGEQESESTVLLVKSQNNLKMYQFLIGARENAPVNEHTHTQVRKMKVSQAEAPLSLQSPAAGSSAVLVGHKSNFHLRHGDGLGNGAPINHPDIDKGKCPPRPGKVRGVTGQLTAHLWLDGTQFHASPPRNRLLIHLH